MAFALEQLFREVILFFIRKEYRVFILLSLKLFATKRNKKTVINYRGNKITILDKLSFLWQHYEIFYKKYYWFETDNTNPVIIDCGSNIGLSALYFKSTYPGAYIECYEPDLKIFQILQKNTSHLKNIKLFNKAIWSKDEYLDFESNGNDDGRITNSHLDTQKVKAQSLRTRLHKHKIIHMLKIDIEGAEYEVLQSVKDDLNNVQNIFIECHTYNNKKQRIDEILSILTQNNFIYYIINHSRKNAPLSFINQKNSGLNLQINIFATKV